MIAPDQIVKLRERLGISRGDLADLLNASLRNHDGSPKSYSADTVARWERGRPLAKTVNAFLEELAVSGHLDVEEPFHQTVEPDPLEHGVGGPQQPQDSPPGPGPGADPQRQLAIGGGAWAKACEELWEMIATGVGMVGAATSNEALMNDGAIIAYDKAALGAAWGKLAETNETFRKMLIGMTEGGAWLQVAMVTGTTVSKCWGNHQSMRLHADLNAHVEPQPSDVER